MKKYYKYLLVIIIVIFSFYYTDKVIELSNYNNTILASINNYALVNDNECIEGYINSDGIVLGYNGIKIDKNKSYSNMKGIGFKKDLLEYKKNKCILNKEDNLDKYIKSGNKIENKISLVIDINDMKYYDYIDKVSKDESIEINYLIDKDKNGFNNVLYKTNKNDIKEFKKKYSSFYCVNYNNFDLLEYCKKEKINSIRIINYIDKDLLLNTKKILDKGVIIFIKENDINIKELIPTIKYIKSRGFKIVTIDELLS